MTGHRLPDDPSLMQRIDDVAVRFEHAWKTGPRPCLTAFVPADWPHADRAALLPYLLDLDVTYRRRAGETPAAADYAGPLPDLADAVHAWFDHQPTHFLPPTTSPTPEPPPPIRSPLPMTFGRYRVLAHLGHGSYGDVYKASDPDLHRFVAVKVPRPRVLSALGGSDAFLREAQILGSLSHPHIVPVYDFGRLGDSSCFIVSQFIDGTNLAARLKEGRLPFADTARLIAAIADALHYAHLRKLVHRDVKPANILLDKAGTPYLADFGLALREADVGRGQGFVGTFAYMNPEQARGEGHRVTGSSDIFSLGIVLYEMLAGQRPYTATDREELRQFIIHVDPAPPRQRDDTIPPELERVCLKALAKRVPERYTTARDLAEDLRAWLAAPPASPSVPALASLPPPAHTAAPGPVPVVFKGLRSFDARDADFFLPLVPGPRDRDGLPERLRFWKARLEETDADATFPVGLLYGPSGSGKSSLVKAGLLPRLAPHVVPVYVEAGPGDTEARLLRGLHKVVPDLPASLGLAEVLARLRRTPLPGRKVVLVLDQFEQWLHGRRGSPELVAALRQCDGVRTQALLLVRDDFWMAVSRLFHDLEVSLVEGHNCAAADLFDERHARKVLAAFGRGLGNLPAVDDLAPVQGRFVGEAVAALAEGGRVFPVRLALFTQMVKSRPWVEGTMKELGGLAGLEVRFLAETFSPPDAPPAHLLHQKAARRVLHELLPEPGGPIKGRLRTREQLRAASGYAARPRDFAELVHILDAELRLITPTEPAAADPETTAQDAPPAPVDPPYQLTHDYLVPSVREWLNSEQDKTWSGRARRRLEDRAAEWTRSADARHLPAWWEWLSIRLFTRPRDWTEPQRRLMRRADRRCVLQGVLLLPLVALLAWGLADRASDRLKASARVDRLLAADTRDVPPLLDDLEGCRPWANDLLRRRLGSTPSTDKERLHIALALAPDDPGQRHELCRHLLEASRDELPVIVQVLRPHQDSIAESLWSIARQDLQEPAVRLRAAAALAQLQPGDPRWTELAPALVPLLVTAAPAAAASTDLAEPSWAELLAPVGYQLVPALDDLCRSPARLEAERAAAGDLLAAFHRDQPAGLAKLLLDGGDRTFRALLPRVQSHLPEVLAALSESLRQTEETLLFFPPADSRRSLAARRQAAAVLALACLGRDDDSVRDLWARAADPEVRAWLASRAAPAGLDAGRLVEMLEHTPDAAGRFALVLALGEYGPEQLPPAQHKHVAARLLAWYEHDPDPGLHAAIDWLLRHDTEGDQPRPLSWRRRADLDSITQAAAVPLSVRRARTAAASLAAGLAAGPLTASAVLAAPEQSGWEVNGQRMTFTFLSPPPDGFLMGTPTDGAVRFANRALLHGPVQLLQVPAPAADDWQPAAEPEHRRRIGRPFALAGCPVTVAQFQHFLAASPDLAAERQALFGRDLYRKKHSPAFDGPMIDVSWFEAARFCNWLSEKEGLPREQWCYPDRVGPGSTLFPDALERAGYRLPTEAEWEYACRAGTRTPRFFGRDDALLGRYAWHQLNSQGRAWPVGQKRPNDWGLFDLYGNVWTWCHNAAQPYPAGGVANDSEDDAPGAGVPRRVLRGGSCEDRPAHVRSACRLEADPSRRLPLVVGIRVARTCR